MFSGSLLCQLPPSRPQPLLNLDHLLCLRHLPRPLTSAGRRGPPEMDQMRAQNRGVSHSFWTQWKHSAAAWGLASSAASYNSALLSGAGFGPGLSGAGLAREASGNMEDMVGCTRAVRGCRWCREAGDRGPSSTGWGPRGQHPTIQTHVARHQQVPRGENRAQLCDLRHISSPL